MLRSVGHQKVLVLNGGLNYAKENKFPMSSKIEIPEKANEFYQIDNWLLLICNMMEVEKATRNSKYQIVDVRKR